MRDYKITYRVEADVREIVLRDIKKIMYDDRKGPGFHAFYADITATDKVAEFRDVLSVIPCSPQGDSTQNIPKCRDWKSSLKPSKVGTF